MADDLAIVIPLGPGETSWRGLLPSLGEATRAELVFVVTAEQPSLDTPLPEGLVRLVVAPRGRAVQMNAGARATSATWLWFLHADSRLPDGALQRLRGHLLRAPPGIAYFDLRFLPDGPGLVRINEWGAWFRSRWLGLPFGDQGFLMQRDTFEALGGFDESLPGGEDHALVWKARAAGIPVVPIGAGLLTSARKYQRSGWLGTTLSHLWQTWLQARRFSRSGSRE